MKKTKLTLEKFRISKLSAYNIKGGNPPYRHNNTGLGGGGGSTETDDDPESNEKCLFNSIIKVPKTTNEQDAIV
ncbi:hypothetical protein [Tenacibaculum amylolyticum]|uniref:hypothetical protein n=1 Tax=Tenacibaculum amylolyticum TaxID=104269 RepID=UPI0038B6AFBF